MRKAGLTIAALLFASACASDGGRDEAALRLNQIQSIGTHNSYKQAISAPEMKQIRDRNADLGLTLDYSHRPLAEQLDMGARQLELDPTWDPTTGAFADPMGPKLLRAQGIDVPAFDFTPLKQPGVKIIHVTDIDYRSSCSLFADCLKQIKAWSDKHRTHSPILIMINPKHSPLSWPGATPVQPFGKQAFEDMEREIASVFPRERMVTPDEVRGAHATLRGGATAGGWPTLAASRGKVIFTIDDSPERWKSYAEGHPSLKGRLAFVNADKAPDAPEAAYMTMNEPLKDQALIRERAAQGFLIRTRADADTREARTGETARREAAFASGAQFISTDYLWEDQRFGTAYTATLPGGGEVRCNPVTAAPGCSLR